MNIKLTQKAIELIRTQDSKAFICECRRKAQEKNEPARNPFEGAHKRNYDLDYYDKHWQ